MRAISSADLVSNPCDASLALSVVRPWRLFVGSCGFSALPVSVCEVKMLAMMIYSPVVPIYNSSVKLSWLEYEFANENVIGNIVHYEMQEIDAKSGADHRLDDCVMKSRA